MATLEELRTEYRGRIKPLSDEHLLAIVGVHETYNGPDPKVALAKELLVEEVKLRGLQMPEASNVKGN